MHAGAFFCNSSGLPRVARYIQIQEWNSRVKGAIKRLNRNRKEFRDAIDPCEHRKWRRRREKWRKRTISSLSTFHWTHPEGVSR